MTQTAKASASARGTNNPYVKPAGKLRVIVVFSELALALAWFVFLGTAPSSFPA